MTSNKDLDTITQTLTPFTTFDALKRAPEFILSLNIVNPMAVILANAYLRKRTAGRQHVLHSYHRAHPL